MVAFPFIPVENRTFPQEKLFPKCPAFICLFLRSFPKNRLPARSAPARHLIEGQANIRALTQQAVPQVRRSFRAQAASESSKPRPRSAALGMGLQKKRVVVCSPSAPARKNEQNQKSKNNNMPRTVTQGNSIGGVVESMYAYSRVLNNRHHSREPLYW